MSRASGLKDFISTTCASPPSQSVGSNQWPVASGQWSVVGSAKLRQERDVYSSRCSRSNKLRQERDVNIAPLRGFATSFSYIFSYIYSACLRSPEGARFNRTIFP